MIHPVKFANKQFDLLEAFGLYVFDHPEVDALLPAESFVYFEVADDEKFNAYSRELAAEERRKGIRTVCARFNRLPTRKGSRKVKPEIRVDEKAPKPRRAKVR